MIQLSYPLLMKNHTHEERIKIYSEKKEQLQLGLAL
jgi:hypothetical protein